ncbi:endonuclease domain-containing protein [Candidatus Binatus sp.]|uniref:endonuclease domain-containing protein n=1 Tax=Candidatus Binatus sp. TaxID=2811406 RepID=UPI0032C21F2C
MPFEPTLPRDTARKLRRDQTEAEQKLWSRLRRHQMKGLQFRRQLPIGRLFADFVCLETKLIIEVDGSQHADQTDRDESRSEFLRGAGYKVLRFWNYEVIGEIDQVVQRIADALEGVPRRIKRKRL